MVTLPSDAGFFIPEEYFANLINTQLASIRDESVTNSTIRQIFARYPTATLNKIINWISDGRDIEVVPGYPIKEMYNPSIVVTESEDVESDQFIGNMGDQIHETGNAYWFEEEAFQVDKSIAFLITSDNKDWTRQLYYITKWILLKNRQSLYNPGYFVGDIKIRGQDVIFRTDRSPFLAFTKQILLTGSVIDKLYIEHEAELIRKSEFVISSEPQETEMRYTMFGEVIP